MVTCQLTLKSMTKCMTFLQALLTGQCIAAETGCMMMTDLKNDAESIQKKQVENLVNNINDQKQSGTMP